LSTGEPLSFEVSQAVPGVFVGKAVGIGGTQVVREMRLDSDTLAIANAAQVVGAPAQYKTVRIAFSEPKHEPKPSSFLMPSYDHQELLVKHGTKIERTNITGLTENLQKSYSGATLASLGSQYFATAMVDKSGVNPEVIATATTGADPLQVEVVYSPTPSQEKLDLKFISYTGPKSHDVLKAVDADLAQVIDLGIFSAIGEILLWVMQWFHQLIPNWGVAIILLTILVRLIVLPFNMFSYKSMKKMQQIQPQMTSIRERYKEDPPTMQKEIMALMKEQKVNPLGGCLPMLLQMPVFFALYQVLGQSIELYKAPFFGWIVDLSLKDPYFVLPVLMGAAMYVQQKITPTTMDPAQAKIMQFLPIVFSLMMVSLPSGLTLYIFISTVFGIVQQQMFMRDGGNKVVAKPAKA